MPGGRQQGRVGQGQESHGPCDRAHRRAHQVAHAAQLLSVQAHSLASLAASVCVASEMPVFFCALVQVPVQYSEAAGSIRFLRQTRRFFAFGVSGTFAFLFTPSRAHMTPHAHGFWSPSAHSAHIWLVFNIHFHWSDLVRNSVTVSVGVFLFVVHHGSPNKVLGYSPGKRARLFRFR
jgi:hypothetical protein